MMSRLSSLLFAVVVTVFGCHDLRCRERQCLESNPV